VMHPGRGLLFLGRLDHQTKIRGYRIDLQEIETVVRAATGCESVAALAWPPDEPALARRIVVFIAGEATEDDIIAQCELKLPPVMVPHQIRFVPDWPLTANGKTDYAALKQRLKDALC
jgi:acyl-CoA synthetase (AMP-forming)/AMP-acid ligase II